MASRPVTMRIEDETVDQLDALAKATDRPRAWHVEQAVQSYLSLQSWQVTHIKQGLAELEVGQGIPQDDIEAYLSTWGADTPTASTK